MNGNTNSPGRRRRWQQFVERRCDRIVCLGRHRRRRRRRRRATRRGGAGQRRLMRQRERQSATSAGRSIGRRGAQRRRATATVVVVVVDVERGRRRFAVARRGGRASDGAQSIGGQLASRAGHGVARPGRGACRVARQCIAQHTARASQRCWRTLMRRRRRQCAGNVLLWRVWPVSVCAIGRVHASAVTDRGGRSCLAEVFERCAGVR
jgi:hypothetical protein